MEAEEYCCLRTDLVQTQEWGIFDISFSNIYKIKITNHPKCRMIDSFYHWELSFECI